MLLAFDALTKEVSKYKGTVFYPRNRILMGSLGYSEEGAKASDGREVKCLLAFFINSGSPADAPGQVRVF
jgi:hypothetical protein